jgi:uncharacterized membrane protein
MRVMVFKRQPVLSLPIVARALQQPAGSRPPLRFFLLSHHSYNKISHTIQFRFGSRRVYLCARCTGIGVGLVTGLFYVDYLANSFVKFPGLILVFGLPAIADWLFQVFRLKESTNPRRLLTGALVGNAYLVGIVAIARGWFGLLIFYGLAFAGISASLYVIFRMTGIMDDYLARSWPLS